MTSLVQINKGYPKIQIITINLSNIMNNKLLKSIDSAIGRTKEITYEPSTADALRARLSEELDWLDADPGRECLVVLLRDLASGMRSARIPMSPGYSFLPDSILLYLNGVTKVDPVEWDLPFRRFSNAVHDGAEIPFEAGPGSLAVARDILSNRENELILETAPGVFKVTFLDGDCLRDVTLRITEFGALDKFRRTVRDGWHQLDEAALRLFRRGSTDGSVWFETDRMREMLSEFEPESMSDLVLLNSIYYPGRIALYPEILRRKQSPGTIPSTGNANADRILRDTYGVLVYQEQALMLQEAGCPVDTHLKDLALKGHEVARTMLSVEALWPRRLKTSLR